MYLILEAFMLVSLGGLIAAFQNDLAGWTVMLKALTSRLFVFAAVCGYRKREQNKKISRTMMIAFLCSLAGDVLLALDKEEGILFILGVVSFALAHVMFSVSFCRISAVKRADLAGDDDIGSGKVRFSGVVSCFGGICGGDLFYGCKGIILLSMQTGERAGGIPDYDRRRVVSAFRCPAAFLAFRNRDSKRDPVFELDSLLSGAGMFVCLPE